MKLLGKNFVIFALVATIAGIFSFHWFLLGKTMPADECFSINCIYSSPQTIPPETRNILLASITSIFLIAFLPLTIWFGSEFKELPSRMFLERRSEGIFDRFTSWLRILEKRDPGLIIFGAG